MMIYRNYLRLFQSAIILAIFSVCLTLPLYAPIPDQIRLSVVFDYDDAPLHGTYDVTVQLAIDDDDNVDVEYMETVADVNFSYGAAYVYIGGQGTDLINELFDDPDMVITISVLQHQLEFPLTSIPYSMRTLEANKARRVDDESIIIFLEDEHRVGINLLEPEVTLDINGGVIIRDILTTDTVEDGVLFWDGNENQFFVYSVDDWITLSFMPDAQERSKWVYDLDTLSITSTRSVGIGVPPGSHSLAVANDASFSGYLTVGGDVDITSSLLTEDSLGLSSDGSLVVPSVELATNNLWESGDLTFSGILHGDGSSLSNLHQFSDGVFQSNHIVDLAIDGTQFEDSVIYSEHVVDLSIGVNKIATDQITGDYIDSEVIQPDHVIDNSIQIHHMQKGVIGSIDIEHNTFKKEKFQDDVILTQHIVDNQITDSKFVSRNIVSSNILDNAITGDIIQDGQIQSHHLPLNSLPLSSLESGIEVDKGGTGQTTYEDLALVYVSSESTYDSNASKLSLIDEHLGIGITADAQVLLKVVDDENAQMSIVSNGDNLAGVQLRSSFVTWNIQVFEGGTLELSNNNLSQMAFTYSGYMGIGTSNPTEVLTLTGEVVLGDAQSDAPGTIKYKDGQFFSRTVDEWHPLNPASFVQRSFNYDQMSNLSHSSVTFSDESILMGAHQWVDSVGHSTILGHSMRSSNVFDTHLEGAFLSSRQLQNSYVSGAYLDLDQVVQSKVFGQRIHASMVYDSYVQGVDSRMGILEDVLVEADHASLLNLSGSSGQFSSSTVTAIQDSVIDSDNAVLSSIFSSDFLAVSSVVHDAKFITGDLFSSFLFHNDTVQLDISNSWISDTRNGLFAGEDIIVFGGDGHHIQSNNHISFVGDNHEVDGDRSIAIGNNIAISHNDVTLINASDAPLSSDRDGQLKIQADGGVRINFSPDSSISMIDGGGSWVHISDRNLKTDISDVDIFDVLEKVQKLPIQYWEYKSQRAIQHIGPTAQDFYKLFNYGNSSTVIHSIDSDGVLLASIKGLYNKLEHATEVLEQQHDSVLMHEENISGLLLKIDQVKNQLADLEKLYQKNTRLISQFNKDHDDQNNMIDYISSTLDRLVWRDYLVQLKSIWGILMLILLGLGSGLGCSWVMMRRRL